MGMGRGISMLAGRTQSLLGSPNVCDSGLVLSLWWSMMAPLSWPTTVHLMGLWLGRISHVIPYLITVGQLVHWHDWAVIGVGLLWQKERKILWWWQWWVGRGDHPCPIFIWGEVGHSILSSSMLHFLIMYGRLGMSLNVKTKDHRRYRRGTCHTCLFYEIHWCNWCIFRCW